MTDYPIVRNKPIAKFFYKGQSHSHPVRRTVVLIENQENFIRGIELREGASTRDLTDAPIKTYSKDSIATIGELDRRRVLRTNSTKKQLGDTTLSRYAIADLGRIGI